MVELQCITAVAPSVDTALMLSEFSNIRFPVL
jgi:hypothetical protein